MFDYVIWNYLDMLKVRNAKKPTLRLSPQRRSRPQLEHQNLSSPAASGSYFEPDYCTKI
ncbi:MAG: hypothetical protein ACFKPT_00170 [Gloeotrichia echinulata GP01]